MSKIIGIAPEFDYLYDPQQKRIPVLGICDSCGSEIREGDRFFRLIVGKTVVSICQDCTDDIEECIAGED